MKKSVSKSGLIDTASLTAVLLLLSIGYMIAHVLSYTLIKYILLFTILVWASVVYTFAYNYIFEKAGSYFNSED